LPQTAPYGSWRSPITSDLIVGEQIEFEQIEVEGQDIYWIELHPQEGGRYVIVHRTPDGRISDLTPPPYNARSAVHEYGGRAFAVYQDTLYFSNYNDHRIYRQTIGEAPVPLTAPGPLYYADMVVDPHRLRLHCVLEDHSRGDEEPVNSLISVDLVSGEIAQTLADGNDFYSSPRLSPDGSRLAFVTWNHPDMPWDRAELWVGHFDGNGALGDLQQVAGDGEEAVLQPEWAPDGSLVFVSDRSDWWNLYRWDGEQAEPLLEMPAEFGRPQWLLGRPSYGFTDAEHIAAAYVANGVWHFGLLDTASKSLTEIETPFSEYWWPRPLPGGEQVVFIGGSPTAATAIALLDLQSGEHSILRRNFRLDLDPGYLSSPQPIEFPTADGQTAHGLYYPPHNQAFQAPTDQLPPLIVRIHGGPTSAVKHELNLEFQFWTSRGFALLNMDYRGSTGYGRPYRQSLYGQWGVAEVQDCIHGARYLVERRLADPQRLIIAGKSAGGYTTLQALTTDETFKAGASRYGVSDLTALTQQTHKFEVHYLEKLVGPYPQRQDLYRQRSPLHHSERLSSPVIFFQGLEDKVVPPEQSARMAQALREKGVPVAYVTFEGEGHKFRRAENLKRALENELYFYSRVFGFELADPVEPVEIDNL